MGDAREGQGRECRVSWSQAGGREASTVNGPARGWGHSLRHIQSQSPPLPAPLPAPTTAQLDTLARSDWITQQGGVALLSRDLQPDCGGAAHTGQPSLCGEGRDRRHEAELVGAPPHPMPHAALFSWHGHVIEGRTARRARTRPTRCLPNIKKAGDQAARRVVCPSSNYSRTLTHAANTVVRKPTG